MMRHLFIIVMLSADVAADPSGDLCDKMKALELFLQDGEDYKEYCPELEWEQPTIEVYREKLKSQLPEKCKKE